MIRHAFRFTLFLITLPLTLVFALGCAPALLAQNLSGQSSSLSSQPTVESATAPLKFRSIGPAIMMGRIDDLAVVESDPQVIYLGAATGGVWKTTDGGMTWKSLFDREPDPSIGAIAIAPSNPSIVWVGTGEANNRQSASWGDGVYKSTDGGATWKHLGLEDTQAIGRIVIDPHNSDVVYVAALGHLWGPNAERGLFKTTDGGKTWQKVLFINDDTGVSDVAIDPLSPNILYAAAYERRRTAWGFNGGRAWLRHLQDDRRRRDLEETDERFAGQRQYRPHRPLCLPPQPQYRLRPGAEREPRRFPQRRSGRDMEADERHGSPAVLFQPDSH